ncbi:hypothetical protein TKK_0014801 [Trichogramma kaykai]
MHKTFEDRWNESLRLGLPEEVKEELMIKYPTPENCTFLDPPKLNKEIDTALTEACKSRDARIASKHEKLQVCLGASDVARLVTDAIRDEILIRRSLILSIINTTIKDSFIATEPVDRLFGKDLSERLRQVKLAAEGGSIKWVQSAKIEDAQSEIPEGQTSLSPSQWSKELCQGRLLSEAPSLENEGDRKVPSSASQPCSWENS